MRLWLKLDDVDEYDVKYGSWRLYDALYKNSGFIPSGIDFETDVKKTGKRRFTTKLVYHNGNAMNIVMSGETDFNFSDKRIFGLGKSRVQYFSYFLKEVPKEERKRYLELLDCCKKKHHSQANISLMPMTGGLNLEKKSIGNDRVDTFVWALKEYYKGNTGLLLNCCSNENMPVIKQYLRLFTDVYDYCNTIYFIDKSLVKDLIRSGAKPIDNYQRAMEYMSLAIRFWNQKENVIDRYV